MLLIVNKYLVPKGFCGLTLFPFVFLKHQKYKEDAYLINHERIHLRQQLELGILLFYIFYLIEFLVRYLQYKNKDKAYRNISFEREAYANENDLFYLKKRKVWEFLGYVSSNKKS